MTRSLRLTDLALALGLIVLAVMLVAKHGSGQGSTGAIGPLSVVEATSFFSGRPLAVRGYLVERHGRPMLCSGRSCAGPRLFVSGLRGEADGRRVLAIGIVDNRLLTLLHLPPVGASARF